MLFFIPLPFVYYYISFLNHLQMYHNGCSLVNMLLGWLFLFSHFGDWLCSNAVLACHLFFNCVKRRLRRWPPDVCYDINPQYKNAQASSLLFSNQSTFIIGLLITNLRRLLILTMVILTMEVSKWLLMVNTSRYFRFEY